MQLVQIAQDINMLADYLGPRDVVALEPDALESRYGWRQADAMVLFGGSILAGGDVLAEAMRAGVARHYVIVGGAGHTTAALRDMAGAACPELAVADDSPEADIFAAYIKQRYGLVPDALERASTNCGNNVTYLLQLLRQRGIPSRSLILAQDATMQRRMEAVARKEAPASELVNYATYRVRVRTRRDAAPHGGHGAMANAGASSGACRALPPQMPVGSVEGFSPASESVSLLGELDFEDAPLGMWDMPRYVRLLLGEIPRLVDDEHGYGPRGKGFLAHMDVPDGVVSAWARLRDVFPNMVRAANPEFSSR